MSVGKGGFSKVASKASVHNMFMCDQGVDGILKKHFFIECSMDFIMILKNNVIFFFRKGLHMILTAKDRHLL